MTILRVSVAVVRSRWHVVAGATVVCVAFGIGYAMIAPERFTATSTLLLDPVGTSSASTDSSLRTELDLLRSERVAQRVVENLRMPESAAARTLLLESGDTRQTLPEFLALHLMRHVSAAPVGDGGLVRVSFSAQDPDFAAQVANAYPQAYGEVSLEMRAAAIRNGVERAGQDLALLRVRLEQARMQGQSLRDGAPDSATIRAQEQLARLAQLALQTSGAVFGTRAPQERARAASVGLAEDSVETPGAPQLAPIGSAPSIAGAGSPEQDLRLAQQNLERAEERLARLSAESIGAPFPAHLLVAASAPSAPSKPGLKVSAAIGLVAGLLVGLLAALLIEVFDRRVRRPEDVTSNLGIDVLGDLPAMLVPATVRELAPRVPRRAGLRLQRA